MTIPGREGFYNQLVFEPFQRLCAELADWRLNPYVQKMEKDKSKGRILSFVKGLRFSSQVIYIIRDVLSEHNLETDWGHLLAEGGRYLSPECDIIVHQPGSVRRWNGHEKPVMDFKFIDYKKALAVISCKSFITPGQIDEQYSIELKKHVDNLWLFAECCCPGSVKRIKDAAKKAGYDKAWCLYTWRKWSKDHIVATDDAEWSTFVEALEKLANDQ